jgi:glycosyltransferase involved in cell wall biosynthesis
MRILHVITGLNTGGAESMLAKLLSGMDPARFTSRVLCLLTPGPLAERVRAAGVEVESLGLDRGLPTPGALWRAVACMRRFAPDLVQTWLYHADLLGLVAAKLAGIPRVAWNLRCSDMELDKYRPLTRWTFKANALLSGWPDAVLANSQAGVDLHRAKGYRPKRFALIPNGFDTERFAPDHAAGAAVRAEAGIPEAAPVVGMVARFDPMKGHETFFNAAAQIAREVPGVRFLLCGDGVSRDNPELTMLARLAGVLDKLHLLGRREDAARVMNAMNLFMLSSSFGEGFPNVLGEAMACGIPCVATQVGDAALVLGDAGVAVPPREPRALARAATRVLSMTQIERSALGWSGRQRVLANYALPLVCRQYEDLYLELAGGQA